MKKKNLLENGKMLSLLCATLALICFIFACTVKSKISVLLHILWVLALLGGIYLLYATNKAKALSAWEKVKAARKVDRLASVDYIEQIFDEFMELHGDRQFRDDPAIVGGVAYLDGQPVTVIGVHKGKDLKDCKERNFGMPSPEGYRKAIRLMKQAEKFNRPIITFVNTSGAYPGKEADYP